MTRVVVLALSKWAHYSWLPRGERALTERAQADANADLLARFPTLAAMRTVPELPPFALLPRPACAKVLRVAAALAHARLLRWIVNAPARQTFAARVAPYLLHTIQRNVRIELESVDRGVTLNVLDRAEMTAAGLRLALRVIEDPALRLLVELRVPRPIVERTAQLSVCDARVDAVHDLFDAAYVLVRGEAC
jgi:hypothetical protein